MNKIEQIKNMEAVMKNLFPKLADEADTNFDYTIYEVKERKDKDETEDEIYLMGWDFEYIYLRNDYIFCAKITKAYNERHITLEEIINEKYIFGKKEAMQKVFKLRELKTGYSGGSVLIKRL